VLQDVILDRLGMPFWLSAAVILLMILLYTYKGGVKTIVWTDTLQTAGMLAGWWCAWASCWTACELGVAGAGRDARRGHRRRVGHRPAGARLLGQADAGRHLHRHRDDGAGPGDDAEDHLGARLRDAQKNVVLLRGAAGGGGAVPLPGRAAGLSTRPRWA
jgi:hypothetical protein